MTNANEPVNAAIEANLEILGMYLDSASQSVSDAKKAIAKGSRNEMAGTLLCCKQQLEDIKALYDSTLILHRNAADMGCA